MIDHLGGSDRRYPDPAVWRTLPTKILLVCGTGGRCGNQRSEASSRLRRLGCLPFAGVAANMCSSQKIPRLENQGVMRKYRNRERKAVRRLRRSGCSFLQVCLPACVLRKKLAGEPGDNVKIQKSGAEVCPSPALSRVFTFTGVPAHMRFSAQKNPPAGKPGDFYQAFAVR